MYLDRCEQHKYLLKFCHHLFSHNALTRAVLAERPIFIIDHHTYVSSHKTV